ncbi:RP439 family protein [Candidatus Cardinium hertigii]|uniref:Uncharacterized protein n=1 Tax=Candidatus Cardinium hertigii TaxID=247481 RepID=A0A3N2QCZ4_9BACT|nr:hypothetical protein [Candidatus Cardinium hertigii]ROT47665.1 hypothetical protein EDM02_01325 [Candidatus Cardinium hertigii]
MFFIFYFIISQSTLNQSILNTLNLNNMFFTKRLKVKSKGISLPIKLYIGGGVLTITQACANHKQHLHTSIADIRIGTRSCGGMTVQIRPTQLATRDSQNKLQNILIQYFGEKSDEEREKFAHTLLEKLTEYCTVSKEIDAFIVEKRITANDVGFPIHNNKTSIQLEKAHKWLSEQDLKKVIGHIIAGKFYQGLENTVAPDAFPVLGSPIEESFYGNEVASISSILLASIVTICGETLVDIPGSAAFHPFFKKDFKLPAELLERIKETSYPFVSEKGMWLFGDFQFGGHRRFEEQSLFGPEDASSSVAKAIGLEFFIKDGSEGAGQKFATINAIKSYTDKKLQCEFDWEPVTSLSVNQDKSVNAEEMKKIKPGDVFVARGRMKIFATSPDAEGKGVSFQYTRSIDKGDFPNKSGGGVDDYSLYEDIEKLEKLGKDEEAYIFRPNNNQLENEYSLLNVIQDIDKQYAIEFPHGPEDGKITLQDFRIKVLNLLKST